ncbi:DUF5334 family protein [Pseudohaliea sp.]|uniref:DUF5334 family protein n=1 Tax=Pseudohaliea sp. TaxID=2740289 RepID=UPI0032EFC72D
MNIKHLPAVASIALLPLTGHAWEGEELESGDIVEIERGNLVRPGQEIEVYNYDDGEYEYLEVESVRRYGNEVEVETYDYQEGEYKTLRMRD